MRGMAFWVLVATASLTQTTLADEKADTRVSWVHKGGQFIKSKNGSWYEVNTTTFFNLLSPQKFGEAKRAKDFIDLYDDSRRVYIRLFGGHAEILTKKGDWVKLFTGQWKASE